ncbi:hypothetical protein MKQ70_25135 [Chitinophaga sedimenti]|uniref:hypothetical protein n=1 Tax=Chitinophaga sedimenti TaxID=2033606 RepID=UPI002004676B|nr:hypothetical protein [Chitinophaga sedimenti]MCK7558111.1 hypothetical protein [Chitinophaga sedimenti]
MKTKRSIYFYYPSKVLGGAEVLFATVAKALTIRGFDVTIVDHTDGIYSLLTVDSDVKIIGVNEPIRRDAIIILPPVGLKKFSRLATVDKNAKVLFWFIHPYNGLKIIPRIPPDIQYSYPSLLRRINKYIFPRYYHAFRELMKMAMKNNGVTFMDEENYFINREFFSLGNEQPTYTPIPVSRLLELDDKPGVVRTKITVAYIGRLSDFKIPILKYIISELGLLEGGSQVRLEIIGDGKSKGDVASFAKRYVGLEVVFKGAIPHSELSGYIRKNVDLLFAMGTSALEGGAMMIPTCLLDASYSKVSNYKFRWLFQTTGYTLGRMMNYRRKRIINQYTIAEMLDQVRVDKRRLGLECYRYVRAHHTLDVVVNKLELAITRGDFSFKVLKTII